ncbi:MAG: hypothetical protein ACOY45_15460 [Pseudomonadota bacterium]
MKRPGLKSVLAFAAAAAIVVVAHAQTVETHTGYGKTSAEACSRAKQWMKKLYGSRVTGYSSCSCSTKRDAGRTYYACTVDAYLRERR